MAKTPRKKRQISIPIIIAIISLLGICITTMGAIVVGVFPSLLNIFGSNPNKAETIIFRVTEINGVSVSHAKVILLSENDIHIQYTDSNGVGTFNLMKAETLRVFVETDQYEIYDQIFTGNTPNPIEIRLNRKDVSRKNVIVRVIDDKDDTPINGAEVILIANGSIYSQSTDTNGITKFITAFPADEIDGDISVSVSGFKAEHQRVTLQADRIQDIRLDKTSGTLTVGFTGEGREVARTPEAIEDTTSPENNNENTYSCSSKLLSPEELVNCGVHEYIYTSYMAGTPGCEHDKEGTGTSEILFSKNGDSVSINDLAYGYTEIYQKVDNNTYYLHHPSSSPGSGSNSPSLDNHLTIIFNKNGYELNIKAYALDDGVLKCNYHMEWHIQELLDVTPTP